MPAAMEQLDDVGVRGRVCTRREKLSGSVVCCICRDGNFREESIRKLKISLY